MFSLFYMTPCLYVCLSVEAPQNYIQIQITSRLSFIVIIGCSLEHPYSGHFHLSVCPRNFGQAQGLNHSTDSNEIWQVGPIFLGIVCFRIWDPGPQQRHSNGPLKWSKNRKKSKKNKIEKSKLRVLCAIYLAPFMPICSPNKKYLQEEIGFGRVHVEHFRNG